jgi:hypothetical protein
MVGDSMTRYQFTSLAFFIHKGYCQPRFGETLPSCLHLDKDGVPVCSLEGEPNAFMEYSWVSVTRPGRDPWNTFMQDLGSNIFDGYMEASTARTSATNHTQIAENYHCVAPAQYNGTAQPPSTSATQYNVDHANKTRLMLSFLQELGWGDEPTPIQGFHFTKCAYRGTCIISDALADERVQRALKYDFDFSQPLGDALNNGGAIRQQLPQWIL